MASSDKPSYGGKPMYYGSSGGKSPMYYGGSGKSPMYYGSSKKSPVYYGGGAMVPYYGGGRAPYYYGGGSYGTYGRPYYYGGGSGNGGDDSLVGTITLSRVLRVVSQRWISVLVFLLVGLVAAFAVYRVSPTIFEATSEFTMDMHRPQGGIGNAQAIVEPDYGSTYEEVFNTRLSDWRSEKIVTKIVQQYRANYPAATVTDQELIDALVDSKLELIRHSRLITIAIRSRSAQLAAALANAYAEAIESFTDEENKLRCDKAVAQIHEQVEKQRRADEKIAHAMLEFRTQNQVDKLRGEREILQQSLQKVTTDVLALETETTAAAEWEKVLEAAQETPEDFGALPTDVPRSSDIGVAYTALQKCQMELNSLLTTFTKNHPEVRVKEKEYEILKQQFTESVSRALATAHGNLASFRNQLAVHKKKSENMRTAMAEIEQKIVLAESGLVRLEAEQQVSQELLKQLTQNENAARIAAEQNNEIVRVGRPATVPLKPVLPNPVVIFAAGTVLSLGLGFLFVLALDHLEDTIISLSDIETRLGLKVLAVLPHVRKKKRDEVAKFILENRYSQFAEAVAGLRNLLDSPRYQSSSQVLLLMSTQPGEGKTITSCSLAVSNAQAQKRTLLVDFDLRRPRLARVWGLELDQDHSFSHRLAKGEDFDFAEIVQHGKMECLDIVASLPPDDVDPASIMGSKVVPDFFNWARENYDRVIIDSPPYGIVGDVMTLAAMVDSVMIMCCPDRTHFKPIQHAARSLGEAGATVIGIVVNDVDSGSSGGAFTQVGHTYDKRKHGYYSGYKSYGYGYGGGYGYGHSHYGDDDDEDQSENKETKKAADAVENSNPELVEEE